MDFLDIGGKLNDIFNRTPEQVSADYAVPAALSGSLSDLDALFSTDAMAESAKRRARRERVKPRETLSPEELKARHATRQRNTRKQKRESGDVKIAVLDMETDPFDNIHKDRILPFVCELYSEHFEPIVIWDDDYDTFIVRVVTAIEQLPGKFTIFAHNGGKFDWLFLISRMRGKVAFKGRGIIRAQIGEHELRDSYLLVPEKLAAFQKEKFDYATKNTRANRGAYKNEILSYLHSDCIYLYDVLKTFIGRHGMKISIGAAAMVLIKREYPDIENVYEVTDERLRAYYFGGRVQCLKGLGTFTGDFKLYDVNSMYPKVMADYEHPIGQQYLFRAGKPNANTFFVTVRCYSTGAFPVRSETDGIIFPKQFGTFHVSIHEYRMALELGLIRNVRILGCVDCNRKTDFKKFVLPLYEGRLATKDRLKALAREGKMETAEYIETKKDDIFLKLLMNNGYGKFAENPRRFKDYFLTDFNAKPDCEGDWGIVPAFQCAEYAIWQRPTPLRRYRNVGTSASITGAARAELMRALHYSTNAVYCDTDSIFCEGLSDTVDIHPTRLGAWDLEASLSEITVSGRKMYAYHKINADGSMTDVVKSKGVSGLQYEDIIKILRGETIKVPAPAPTIDKTGAQRYIDRVIRATPKGI